MQEYTPCWQACIQLCERIITSDNGSTENGRLYSFLFSCSLSFTTVVTSPSVCILQLATVLEGEAVSVCVLCSLMNTCCENSTRVVAASNLSFSAHFCFLLSSFCYQCSLLFSFLSLQQSLMPTAYLLLCFLGLFPSVATGHDIWDIILVVRILMRLS